MRTIIAGSRGLGYAEVVAAMDRCGWTPSVVISGTARGVDQAGERWAEERGISVVRCPADWDKYGRGAGYIRNVEMARRADSLVAVWDGRSRGTDHMIRVADELGLRVYIYPEGGIG